LGGSLRDSSQKRSEHGKGAHWKHTRAADGRRHGSSSAGDGSKVAHGEPSHKRRQRHREYLDAPPGCTLRPGNVASVHWTSRAATPAPLTS